MPTRNVNLTDSFDVFIDEQIEAGRYRNASEVMRAGLRLLQQQTAEDGAKLAALRRLAKTGLDQLDQGRGVDRSRRRQRGVGHEPALEGDSCSGSGG